MYIHFLRPTIYLAKPIDHTCSRSSSITTAHFSKRPMHRPINRQQQSLLSRDFSSPRVW